MRGNILAGGKNLLARLPCRLEVSQYRLNTGVLTVFGSDSELAEDAVYMMLNRTRLNVQDAGDCGVGASLRH